MILSIIILGLIILCNNSTTRIISVLALKICHLQMRVIGMYITLGWLFLWRRRLKKFFLFLLPFPNYQKNVYRGHVPGRELPPWSRHGRNNYEVDMVDRKEPSLLDQSHLFHCSFTAQQKLVYQTFTLFILPVNCLPSPLSRMAHIFHLSWLSFGIFHVYVESLYLYN